MKKLVEFDRDGHIAHLIVSRPERHNSLVPELLDELRGALAATERDPEIRVVVLSAEGASFSTGGDLAAFLEHWDEIESYARRVVGGLNQVMLRMSAARVPIIAAVDGWVTGGSLGLVLAADMVLVTPDARFAPFYTEAGFSPDGGWGAILGSVIGARAAAEIQYLNQTLSAEEAVRLGLVNRLVPTQELLAQAFEWAQAVAAKVPASVEATKRLLRRDTAGWASALEAELESFVSRVKQPDTRQAIEDFVQRMRAE